jgi:hypothetical protein
MLITFFFLNYKKETAKGSKMLDRTKTLFYSSFKDICSSLKEKSNFFSLKNEEKARNIVLKL